MNRCLFWAALPMAQPPQVEGRLRALLTTGRRREAPPRHVRVFAAVAILGLTALLAAMRPVAQAQGTPVTPPAEQHRTQQIIVVDAGHGGMDTGAVAADGTREKDLSLAVAQKLRDTLARRGTGVAMTRTTDAYFTLAERSTFANKQQAQLMVSIHCNNSEKPNSHTGTLVYYHGQDATGRRLASDVLANVSLVSGLPALGIKSDTTRFTKGYYVLRASRVPAVLIECGYMDNVRDVAALRTAQTQQRIAEGVADGIRRFLSRNPTPARDGGTPASLLLPVQQTSRLLTKTTPAQAAARLNLIYSFVQSYRRTHAGAYPATLSSPGDLMGDMSAHPLNYGLPDRGADNRLQATDFFHLSDPANTGQTTLVRIFMHGKRPDGTRIGTAKRPGTRDVLAYTNAFVENWRFPEGWRRVGDYLVLWDDGNVTRVPVAMMVRVPQFDPIAATPPGTETPPTLQIAFLGQAGVPTKATGKP